MTFSQFLWITIAILSVVWRWIVSSRMQLSLCESIFTKRDCTIVASWWCDGALDRRLSSITSGHLKDLCFGNPFPMPLYWDTDYQLSTVHLLGQLHTITSRVSQDFMVKCEVGASPRKLWCKCTFAMCTKDLIGKGLACTNPFFQRSYKVEWVYDLFFFCSSVMWTKENFAAYFRFKVHSVTPNWG